MGPVCCFCTFGLAVAFCTVDLAPSDLGLGDSHRVKRLKILE